MTVTGERGTDRAFLLFFLPCLAVFSAVLAPQVGLAQQVVVSAPSERHAAPGTVVSVPIRVESGSAATLRIDPVLPGGWSILIPPPAIEAEAGRPVTRIVSIQIPESAAAGAWLVDFRVRSELPDGNQGEGVLALGRTEITITERTSWALSLVESPRSVRAGASIVATFSLKNTGNHTTQFRFEAESSLDFDVRLSGNTVALAPSARTEIRVSVSTRDNVVNELSHVLRLVVTPSNAAATGGAPGSTDAQATTQIVPVRRQARRLEEGRLPVALTTRGTAESGQADVQVELDVPATRVGDRVYAARVRAPDMRSTASFGERDEYSASVEGRHVGIRLGDQNYEVSDLLDTSFFGFGSELSYDRERLQGAAFVSRTRHVFPETRRAGGFVHLWPHRRLAVEMSGLARGKFEPGESGSVAARWLPVDGTELAAEVAHGQYDIGAGSAVQLSAQGTFPWIVFSGRAEAADPFFLGGIQNSERVQGSFAVRGNHWIRLEGLGRAERRFFDASRSISRALENRLFRGGAGGSFSVGTSRFQFMMLGQFQDRRVAETGLDRAEESVTLRMNFNRRGFGLNATGQTGRIADDGFTDGSFSSIRGSVFKVFGPWALSLTASFLEGVTFFSPTQQERATYGSTLSFDAGRGLSASASAFQSRETGTFSQTFTLFDARVAKELWAGHELEVRARGSQTSFASDVRTGTFSMAYRIPFSVQAPFAKQKSETVVSFRVRDEETGEPLPGVVFMAGGARAETGDDGRARLVLLGDEQFVLLDQESIGLDRIPTVPFPVDIATLGQRVHEDVQQGVVDVGIVRAARLTAQVTLPRVVAGVDAALGRGLDQAALAGLVVEARSGERRFRRLTDEDGRAHFPPLVPGRWEVFVLERTLPETYRTDPERAVVELIPGGVGQARLVLAPKERRIRFVTPGAGVAVSVSAGEAAGIAPEAPDTPQDPDAPHPDTVRVKAGDTLFSLARRHYASQWHWIRIWHANQDVLVAPDVLARGMELRLAPTGPLTPDEWAAIRAHLEAR